LLRVDFVSRHEDEGYFYYVMELGDSLTPGWENDPKLYTPHDLARARKTADKSRLPPLECVLIGVELAAALEFLHRDGLTHRDIKPSNVVFVNGRPKLADVGLVGKVKRPDQVTTWAGTPGYMPPWPEPPGTVSADIYGLGMLLYVISTGSPPASFPALESDLMEGSETPRFMLLNRVILKACRPEPGDRFASATELRAALLEIAN
jgi:serine/threonine protein kinase